MREAQLAGLRGGMGGKERIAPVEKRFLDLAGHRQVSLHLGGAALQFLLGAFAAGDVG